MPTAIQTPSFIDRVKVLTWTQARATDQLRRVRRDATPMPRQGQATASAAMDESSAAAPPPCDHSRRKRTPQPMAPSTTPPHAVMGRPGIAAVRNQRGSQTPISAESRFHREHEAEHGYRSGTRDGQRALAIECAGAVGARAWAEADFGFERIEQ